MHWATMEMLLFAMETLELDTEILSASGRAMKRTIIWIES